MVNFCLFIKVPMVLFVHFCHVKQDSPWQQSYLDIFQLTLQANAFARQKHWHVRILLSACPDDSSVISYEMLSLK